MSLSEIMLIFSTPMLLFGIWATYDTWKWNRARKLASHELGELEALGDVLATAERAIGTAKAELAALRAKRIGEWPCRDHNHVAPEPLSP